MGTKLHPPYPNRLPVQHLDRKTINHFVSNKLSHKQTKIILLMIDPEIIHPFSNKSKENQLINCISFSRLIYILLCVRRVSILIVKQE